MLSLCFLSFIAFSVWFFLLKFSFHLKPLDHELLFAAMERLQRFYEEQVLLHPAEGSFSADGQLSRWSNKDLDPVPRAQKKWEWYHVAGFWIVEGFTSSHVQQGAANVALGLNPGLVLVAYLIGNIIVAVPTACNGYIGAKVRKATESSAAFVLGLVLALQERNGALSYVDNSVQYSVNYPVIARA